VVEYCYFFRKAFTRFDVRHNYTHDILFFSGKIFMAIIPPDTRYNKQMSRWHVQCICAYSCRGP